MKRLLFVLLSLIFIVSSCHKKDCDDSEIPDCVQSILDNNDPNEPVVSIKFQEIDGENFYWLNTGAMAYDGFEYIVDENCDTVCQIGGWFPQECMNNFDNEKWGEIWKKE